VGPRNDVLDEVQTPDPLTGRGNFEREKGSPIAKYRGTLRSSVQTRLNLSRCLLGCGLGWAVGVMC